MFSAIDEALEEDGHCKSYEGCFEIIVNYPNYFEDETAESGPDGYIIRLHCYVIGQSMHYDWMGDTFSEALTKAEAEIYSLIKEESNA